MKHQCNTNAEKTIRFMALVDSGIDIEKPTNRIWFWGIVLLKRIWYNEFVMV